MWHDARLTTQYRFVSGRAEDDKRGGAGGHFSLFAPPRIQQMRPESAPLIQVLIVRSFMSLVGDTRRHQHDRHENSSACVTQRKAGTDFGTVMLPFDSSSWQLK